jgi:hypothetical protein
MTEGLISQPPSADPDPNSLKNITLRRLKDNTVVISSHLISQMVRDVEYNLE